MSERYYGLKLGDIVKYPKYQKCLRIYEVVHLDFLDNNGCVLRNESAGNMHAVCERCEVIANPENLKLYQIEALLNISGGEGSLSIIPKNVGETTKDNKNEIQN